MDTEKASKVTVGPVKAKRRTQEIKLDYERNMDILSAFLDFDVSYFFCKASTRMWMEQSKG